MPHQQFVCTRLFHHHLMQSSRTFSVTFTTSSFSTPAAYGSLKSAPTSRFRRTSLHLRYSTVPKHVLDTTPQGSPRAALPHGALIVDVWRQSELGDMDGEHAVAGATGPPVAAFAPRSDDASGPDGSTCSARAESPGGEMR